MSAQLTVLRLGSKGEGIAEGPTGPIFLPYALAGETVDAEIAGNRGFVTRLIEASPQRVEAICPQFTHCGGCAIQHLESAQYASWKRGLVVQALARAHIEASVEALVDARGDGRRRVTLHVRYAGTGKAMRAQAGFMAARSHSLVDLDLCPILVPALAAAPRIARGIGEALKARGKSLDVQVTATLSGLDVDLRGAGAVDNRERLELNKFSKLL